jgi:prepilin-type N-terminal cleavage/methylation domain-containing protein
MRAMTLIEMMVAMTLLVVVLGTAVGLLVGAQAGGARARVRAELAQQGDYAARLMMQEVRNAGVGVPPRSVVATHVVDAYAGGGATSFDTVVILATATAVGFIGDFPRPDAQYNALGLLHGRRGGNTQSIMWHTENNGSCAPGGTSTCTTAGSSIFFPGEVGCDAIGDVAERTCPWGMRRVVASERLQVVAGNGQWQTVRAGTTRSSPVGWPAPAYQPR